MEGVDLDDVIRKLERCAEASLRWADSDAVRLETTKTEAILFSRGGGAWALRPGHPGREPDGTLCWGGDSLAGDMVRLFSDPGGEPAQEDRQDAVDWGQTSENRQHVRCTAGCSSRPPDGDSPGHHALRIGAYLERG